MLTGCYYRCPIVIEDGDHKYPRFFVLGQLTHYNPLSATATVTLHDLLGSGAYYDKILGTTAFRAPALTRCRGVPGGLVKTAQGLGAIVARPEDAGEEEPYLYHVRLEDGRYIKAPETELAMEYSQMDCDPLLQLRTYEFQHPTWFLSRQKVSRNLHLLRNAAHGFQVLAGCRIFLLPHQVSTIVRCFETLPIRYMLADEVGLGKTVEACGALKILASEMGSLRALIIAPGALISQWASELRYKFGLAAGRDPRSDDLCLLALEDLERGDEILAAHWDMVIVDETHRLLEAPGRYDRVLALSRRVEHLLLLSATPIQDRKEEYRRLLTLLSPDQYGEMDPARFGWIVERQQAIQQTVNQQLKRMDRYDEYAQLIVEKLRGVADSLEDKILLRLLSAARPDSEDGGKEAVSQALSYLCENYRVERRVIRNRRQLIRERTAERTLVELPYLPLSADELYNERGAIQSALAYLAQNSDGTGTYIRETAIPLLGALFSSPWALLETLDALGIGDEGLRESAETWQNQARLEHRAADKALDEDPTLIKGRLLWALNYLDQETDLVDDPDCKIVVFTGYNATLREMHGLFERRYGPMGIRGVAFGAHMDREALEDSVYLFQNDPACRVIFCDELGGEGRNFQKARLILHLDLPWSANALEQRIGRLDRLGREAGMDVLSVVLYGEDTVEEQLFRIWRDGMKLFHQSLSGLEIVTGELGDLICDALADDFENGLAGAFEDILERAEEMRESVEEEQLFDIGAALYRPLAQGIDHVLGLYAREEDNLFASAMLGWSGQAGLEPEHPTEDGLIEFRESRFSPRSAIQSLFVPPDWAAYRTAPTMTRQGKILGSFDRKTAALREDILFFAAGDPVYDAIIRNAVGCSRGRCAAIALPGPFRYTGIVFYYTVEPNYPLLLERGVSPQILSQFKMFLPLEPIGVPVALTKSSGQVPEEAVMELIQSARPKSATHLGRRGRGRLAGSPLESFMSELPPGEWEPLVEGAARRAHSRAVAKMQERSDLETVQKEMTRILSGYLSECLYFQRDTAPVEERKSAYQAGLRALKTAAPKLDSVCFVKVVPHGQP